MKNRVYVIDIEANGLLREATKVHCAVAAELSTGKRWEYRPHEIGDFLSFLREADVVIGHNLLSYDLPLLEKLHGFKFEGKVVDTLIMSRLQDPKRRLPFQAKDKRAGPHSLYAWGVRVGVDKPDYHEWDEFDEGMLHRCSEDVEINKLTFFELMKESQGKDWRNAQLLSFELFKNLHKQEEYGWLVDQEYMHKSIKLLEHWIERIDKIVTPLLPLKLIVEEQKLKGEYKHVSKPFKKNREYTQQVVKWLADSGASPDEKLVGGPFSRINYRITNLNSNEETKDFLLSEGWQPETWNYKKDGKGRPEKDERGNLIKTSPKLSGDDAFIGVNGKIGRLIAKRVQARHRKSQIEGWLSAIRDDGRVSTRVTGMATTGRMKHATVVNVPGSDSFFGSQMRRCFIASPGMKIVGCDSDSCQNRMLAARVGDEFFTNTLLNGTKEDKTSIHYVNQRAIKDVAGLDVSYHMAKTLNYAFMFGASDKKLASSYGSTDINVGTKIREALLSVAAGFEVLVENLTKEWKSNARKKVNDWGKIGYYNGWITGLDGRPILIESEHQILVYMLQSDEAIMMSAAYNLMNKRFERKGWEYGKDYGFLIYYHDEVEVEVREELAEEAAEIMEKCIEDAGKFYKIECPHVGDSKIGDTWLDVH